MFNFKFFSKNKKEPVSKDASSKTEEKYIPPEITINHAEQVLEDGRIYSTERAEKIFTTDNTYEDTNFGFYFGGYKTYFRTASGRWFSAITEFNGSQYNGGTIYETTTYSELRIETDLGVKNILGKKNVKLYKKYFGEPEEG